VAEGIASQVPGWTTQRGFVNWERQRRTTKNIDFTKMEGGGE
jgi:hypothetical protein